MTLLARPRVAARRIPCGSRAGLAAMELEAARKIRHRRSFRLGLVALEAAHKSHLGHRPGPATPEVAHRIRLGPRCGLQVLEAAHKNYFRYSRPSPHELQGLVHRMKAEGVMLTATGCLAFRTRSLRARAAVARPGRRWVAPRETQFLHCHQEPHQSCRGAAGRLDMVALALPRQHRYRQGDPAVLRPTVTTAGQCPRHLAPGQDEVPSPTPGPLPAAVLQRRRRLLFYDPQDPASAVLFFCTCVANPWECLGRPSHNLQPFPAQEPAPWPPSSPPIANTSCVRREKTSAWPLGYSARRLNSRCLRSRTRRLSPSSPYNSQKADATGHPRPLKSPGHPVR